jgi:hypothetical protein
MALAPRFALPQISRRVTAIRPKQICSFSSIALEHQRRDERTPGQQSRTSPLAVTPRDTVSWHVQQRKLFSATTTRPRDHHFDTLKFVERLKQENFTQEQAEAMMKILSDVIEERYFSNVTVLVVAELR